jgi:hypothetical protein
MPTSARRHPRLALAGGSGGGEPPSWYLLNSPKLRQALRLLEMSRLEIIEEIRRELEANPTTAAENGSKT